MFSGEFNMENKTSGDSGSVSRQEESQKKSSERSSGSSDKRGKAPLNKKSTSVIKSSDKASNLKTNEGTDSLETKLLGALNSINSTLSKQNTRIQEQEKIMKDLSTRLSGVEKYTQSCDDEYYDDYYDEGEFGACSNSFEMDKDACSEIDDPCQVIDKNQSSSSKRKADENNNSRFSEMAKRFKVSENCDVNIDETLADTVTDLFRNGIEEERYSDLVKDDINARPKNCEGLVTVKMNQLIWDSVSPAARSRDKKMQGIETSIVKAATILVKVVDKMAKMEGKKDENSEVGTLIDNCNDVLALVGHSNRQINLARKDFLRSEIKQDYTHLCNHNRPFTQHLFGDDVSKSAKELEDCSKITNRMFQNRPLRGMTFPRRRVHPRFRGGYGRGFRGRPTEYGSANTESKNFKRGFSRPYRH